MSIKNKNIDLKEILKILSPLEKKIRVEWAIPNMCYYNFVLNYSDNSTRKILDVGCGYGYGTYYLSKKISKSNIVGIDISEERIQTARKIYSRPNLTYYVCDITENHNTLLSNEGKFDLIVCFEVLEHIPRLHERRFLINLKKLLNKDGILILSTPNKSVWDISSYTFDHINEKEYYELRKALSKYFRIEEEYGALFIPYMFYKLAWKLGLPERIGNRKNRLSVTKKLIKIVIRIIFQPSILLDNIFRKIWKYMYYKRLLLQGCPKKLDNKKRYSKVVLFILKNK